VTINRPVLVHTDITRLDRRLFRDLAPDQQIIDRSLEILSELTSGLEVWIPAFNYDFGRTGIFNVSKDKINVGVINEVIRTSRQIVRSKVPIFSILREGFDSGLIVNAKEIIEPFGPDGEFSELFKRHGQILLFGARFSSLTIIHWVEELTQIKYRYYKEISGEIISNNQAQEVTVRFRVRPTGLDLDYDWPKIEGELRRHALIECAGKNIYLIDVKKLHDCLCARILENELWLLNEDSKASVLEVRKKLGRDFEIGDFE
jgi:aminoglycoside 3-N-acetyltransferase